MCTNLGPRDWLRSVLAATLCLWLGTAPLLAAGSLWVAEVECCCGGESVCLLGGCSCGKTGNARLGECGGLRSADGANDVVAISIARLMGLVPIDVPVDTLLPMGAADMSQPSEQNLLARAPDPPPPRPLGAL